MGYEIFRHCYVVGIVGLYDVVLCYMVLGIDVHCGDIGLHDGSLSELDYMEGSVGLHGGMLGYIWHVRLHGDECWVT